MNEATINAAQCAELLQCAEPTVEELTRKGELPGIKFGRGWIYVKADLLQYLAEKARNDAQERRLSQDSLQKAVPMAPKFKQRRQVPPALPAVLPRAAAQGQRL